MGSEFISLEDVKELYEHQVQKGPLNFDAITEKKRLDEEKRIKRQKEMEQEEEESLDSLMKKREEAKDEKKVKELWQQSQNSEKIQEYKSF